LVGTSLSGVYTFGQKQCTPDSPACCCATGSLTVTQTPGAPNATGVVWLNTCYHNATGVTEDVNLTFPVQLTQPASNLASLQGTAAARTNTIAFQVLAGKTSMSNTVVMNDISTIPYYCGLDSNVYASPFNPNVPSASFAQLGQGSGSGGTAAIVLAVLALIAAGVACWFFGEKITSKLQGMSSKALAINIGFQFFMFVLAAASVGGEWAKGNSFTFSLWHLCGPVPGGQSCMASADVASSAANLLRTVQALMVIGLVVAILAMVFSGVAIVMKLGENSFKAIFALTVLEVVAFFFSICFFGGYFDDQLSAALSLSWGYGLAILCWLLSMMSAPFAKLTGANKSTSK